MKHKIKNIIVKKVLSKKEQERLNKLQVEFPGGITPISETSPNDVFIVGFPKSGNTLMQHIIAHLVYGINEAGSRSMVNLIVPDIYANSHYFRFNEVCYFKSHELPDPRYKKVIYIMRDGREALLSYYHMRQNMGNPVSLEDLYSGNKKVAKTTWGEHITQWENNPYNADMLWLRFEDLKTNKLKELKRICEFLNLENTDLELDKVIEYSSLNAMKKLELRSDWSKMKEDINFSQGKFVREGNINSYKQQVPIEILEKFEALNEKILNKYYLK